MHRIYIGIKKIILIWGRPQTTTGVVEVGRTAVAEVFRGWCYCYKHLNAQENTLLR